MNERQSIKPEILSPAGGKASFLAALAAGADAVYCGLKVFSARMAAENFTVEQLKPLTELAHSKGTSVYVTINAMLRQNELASAAETIRVLANWVRPDALIIQDLAVLKLARLEGFVGDIHFSTLANISFPSALNSMKKSFGVNRVVVPRELNIDEIKRMAAACSKDIGLEVFIHGALCYAVSGRCYWSSYLGGKSGLRGRCVQPCRRRYEFEGETKRYFSCVDLSLDVLVKPLLSIPQIHAWKIEGRKKGPHYVYYTCRAYRLLRDHFSDSKAKKSALELLRYSLGRSGTHYSFLPQRPQNPIKNDSQTGSGLFVGELRGSSHARFVRPRQDLLPGDQIRIGYEDDLWHASFRIGKWIPKGGKFYIKTTPGKRPKTGCPVFLTDRREPELNKRIAKMENELPSVRKNRFSSKPFNLHIKKTRHRFNKPVFLNVAREPRLWPKKGTLGLWMDESNLRAVGTRQIDKIWWWLPPVIWPDEDAKWQRLINQLVAKENAFRFVLNSPWQTRLFPKSHRFELWAGPFCNVANMFALAELSTLGFFGAVVSPELSRDDFFTLPGKSPIPLGIVVSGAWPVCISRILSEKIKTDKPFKSPKSEKTWVTRYGTNYWVFPNWYLDLSQEIHFLRKTGYRLFIHLIENKPKEIHLKHRPGKWNWETGLE
jgi:putative protease